MPPFQLGGSRFTFGVHFRSISIFLWAFNLVPPQLTRVVSSFHSCGHVSVSIWYSLLVFCVVPFTIEPQCPETNDEKKLGRFFMKK